jgi:VWFA-related protein
VGLTAQNTTKPTSDRPTTTLQTAAESTAPVPADVSVKVNVVNVFATVRDKHHNVVNNLTKDDFALSSNSLPQTIRYFSQENNLPLTLGLLVDTSLSQREVLDDERSASYKFLDQMLHEKDLAFVLHFDREVELLQDVTSSRSKLENALQSLRIVQPTADPDSNAPQSPDSGPGHRHMRRAGTLLNDAVYLASEELMKNRTGRKAVVVLTDGVDRGSKES